ncbi:hypothetical protein M409DRAFT_55327 [Zasmidium cellare ATCC 36951]|uniref:Uncharacterized protein n=1 Tax=Zasmidium cellare ATCC 36951 TaxID=1080233 RepID=A0A6A6CKM0_ZASCE|nr:uncharacterized protein M409DRAFT_55327 [Zasmidium cellare ATCC 36951]KAF2165966.1 hypothetical protein M409DRAFT_55327 [Zasmidium cellare ATCC 36951]
MDQYQHQAVGTFALLSCAALCLIHHRLRENSSPHRSHRYDSSHPARSQLFPWRQTLVEMWPGFTLVRPACLQSLANVPDSTRPTPHSMPYIGLKGKMASTQANASCQVRSILFYLCWHITTVLSFCTHGHALPQGFANVESVRTGSSQPSAHNRQRTISAFVPPDRSPGDFRWLVFKSVEGPVRCLPSATRETHEHLFNERLYRSTAMCIGREITAYRSPFEGNQERGNTRGRHH